jgi:hypothetical protein
MPSLPRPTEAQEIFMTLSRIHASTLAAAACSIFLTTISGCKAAPPPPAQRADYSQTLNKYYEGRPMCLWQETVKFPVEAATPGQIDQLGLAGLVNAGLLVMQPAGKDAPQGSKTFDLSPEGRTALNPDVFRPGAGNFCYGRRKILSIDAARRNSTTTELVDYHYSVAQPASWATEISIQSAFPQVGPELSGPHMAQATLLDTTDGWQISGTPASIAPAVAHPHSSALAKATGLLHLKKKVELSAAP